MYDESTAYVEELKLTTEELERRTKKNGKIIPIQEIRATNNNLKTKKDFIAEKEQKIEDLKQEIKDKIIFSDVDSSIPYVYDKKLGIYEQLTYSKLRNKVIDDFIEIPHVMDYDITNIANTLYSMYKRNIIPQDFKKILNHKKLNIAFNNGTLYFKQVDNEIIKEFKYSHDMEDFNILKLSIDFEDISNFKTENSIFFKWLEKKFKNKNYEKFFALYIADLLQPFNYSQTALFLWGAGGIGKNVFENILKQNIEANISALEVEDLAKRFQNTSLIESVINISNEISKKDVSSKMFNKCISRESIMFEYKGRDTFMARPLAKWLIFANNPLNIEMTSGVRRRILSLEMKEERIHEWQGKPISKHEFEKLMLADTKGFTYFIILGTMLLLYADLDVKSAYDKLIGEQENEKLEEYNQNQFQDFLQEYLVEDKNSAILIRELTEAYNYLVRETDNPIVAGGEVTTIKKIGFELRNNKKYSKNLCILDNPKRGLKKGTYLFGYRFAMSKDEKGLSVENIEKIDSIEFLRSELNKK